MEIYASYIALYEMTSIIPSERSFGNDVCRSELMGPDDFAGGFHPGAFPRDETEANRLSFERLSSLSSASPIRCICAGYPPEVALFASIMSDSPAGVAYALRKDALAREVAELRRKRLAIEATDVLSASEPQLVANAIKRQLDSLGENSSF